MFMFFTCIFVFVSWFIVLIWFLALMSICMHWVLPLRVFRNISLRSTHYSVAVSLPLPSVVSEPSPLLHKFCMGYSASTDRSEDRICTLYMTRINFCGIQRHFRKIYRMKTERERKPMLSVPKQAFSVRQ